MKSKISIIFLIIIAIITFSNIVYADSEGYGPYTEPYYGGGSEQIGWRDPTTGEYTLDESQGDSYVDGLGDLSLYGQGSAELAEDSAFTAIIRTITGTISLIASAVSVIVLIIMGIKYMVGSAEEKANYKSRMIPYVIGAVFVFGITSILNLVLDVANVFN